MSKVRIINQTNHIVGDILVHTEIDAVMDDHKIELVPEEGYTDEMNQDGSKKFTCKQCDKVCKSESGAKQHIASVHMTGKPKGMKRTSGKNQSGATSANKKSNKFEEFEFGPVEHSTQLRGEGEDLLDNTQNIDEYCALNLDNDDLCTRTFN